MGDSTANPMDRWVCCGSPMNGNHAHGCVYSRPSWPVRTDYGTPSPAGGGETESGWPGAEAGRALGRHIAEEQALGEFGIKASKMAPSQMEAILNMARVVADLRARLAAVEGERERVMADYASELAMIFADRKANRMELLAKAAAVEEQVRLHEATIERQAEAIGILQRAESEAERRGAERAAQYCQTTAVVRHGITDYKDMADELANEIRALFPPPGAEVGRG